MPATDGEIVFPNSEQLHNKYFKITRGNATPTLDSMRLFTSSMENYAVAQHVVALNKEGKALPRSPGDAESSRVLGSAAAFMQMCGFSDVADKFMSEIPKIIVDVPGRRSGFATQVA